MSETEAAWLAGFFDGEGSLTCYMGGRGKKYRCWFISVPNTHLGSLEKCVSITGCGNIKTKCIATEGTKHQWTWRVFKQRDIVSIITQIRPYLTVKKDKADEFINEWSDITPT